MSTCVESWTLDIPPRRHGHGNGQGKYGTSRASEASTIRCWFSGRLLGGIGDLLSSILDTLLAVVLFVLVISETAVSTGSGIDPRQIWRPTELEKTLAWTLEDVPTPTSHEVRVITIGSPLQTLSSELHAKVVRPEDDSDTFTQNTSGSGGSLDIQQPLIPASNTAALIECEFPDCGRAYEFRHLYQQVSFQIKIHQALTS